MDKYITLSSKSLKYSIDEETLQQKVNRYINHGYKPVGGIFIEGDTDALYKYHQAMFKED